MNEFSYVIGTTRQVREGLIFWAEKAKEYVNTYYQGDEQNAKETRFYRGIIKTRIITDSFFEKEESLRSVFDDQNLLASACITQETSIFVEEELVDCIEIESIVNSPWNLIKYLVPEKRKGAATAIVEGIIKERSRKAIKADTEIICCTRGKEFLQRFRF